MIADRWGVTDAEVARHYPCDDVVPAPVMQAWRGVTVPAAPEALWPWLTQIRLAPYSYDLIDNLGRRSPRELRGLSEPIAGQHFTTAAGRPVGRILSVVPGEQLTGRIMGAVMSYVLVPDSDSTRLVLKIVMARGRWLAPLVSMGDLVMARRQLLNFKELASESTSRTGDKGKPTDMIDGLLKVPRQIAESALSVLGVRTGTEEPPHTVQRLGDGVEIRGYQARIAAEVTVTDDEVGARSAGFRLLAGYIFGANHGKATIAMTAPVAQQRPTGTKIAMTAPVAQSAGTGGDWVIRFYMPSRWTMEQLPTPDDDRVRLVEVPAETVAVLRFSGSRDAAAVASHTEQLQNTLRAYGFDAIGEPTAWFYDPPWTLAFLRRNEVAIPVIAS